ncbi:hypothetical protein Bca4012_055118 [Brassica carinata]
MRDLRGDDKSSMHQLPFPSLNAKLIRRKCRNHRFPLGGQIHGFSSEGYINGKNERKLISLKAGVLVGTGMGHWRTTPFLFIILLQAGVLVMESLEPVMKRGAPFVAELFLW